MNTNRHKTTATLYTQGRKMSVNGIANSRQRPKQVNI